MLRGVVSIFIIVGFMATLTGCNKKLNEACGKVQKVLKKGTLEEKYAAAVCFYEHEEYYKASILFDEITPLVVGDDLEEDVEYYNAYCYYYQKNLYYSSYYFKKFYTKYPRSIHAEEMLFMHAKSLYENSPPTNLDQENTIQAIKACQAFINRYPESKLKEECTVIIDKLQVKLETKAFDNARLYYKIGKYKAAVISLGNFAINYPVSDLNENASFLKFKSQYLYASKSIEVIKKEGKILHLKRDRYTKAKTFYYDFIDKYASSDWAKEAENIYGQINKQLEDL